eukprot:9479844-Pyramimonas_sp.AAC.1
MRAARRLQLLALCILFVSHRAGRHVPLRTPTRSLTRPCLETGCPWFLLHALLPEAFQQPRQTLNFISASVARSQYHNLCSAV